MNKEQKIKTLYKICIMMTEGNTADVILAESVAGQIFALPGNRIGMEARANAVDEAVGQEIVISFRSALAPCDIKANAWAVVSDNPLYLYADIMYQWPYDINPDRTVVWSDGRQQEYMGRVEWIESN